MESVKLKASLIKRLAKFSWVRHAQRLAISKEFSKSRPTIDNYINGDVANLEFAEKLIKRLEKVQKIKLTK
jgi:hypothetical protein